MAKEFFIRNGTFKNIGGPVFEMGDTKIVVENVKAIDLHSDFVRAGFKSGSRIDNLHAENVKGSVAKETQGRIQLDTFLEQLESEGIQLKAEKLQELISLIDAKKDPNENLTVVRHKSAFKKLEKGLGYTGNAASLVSLLIDLFL